MFRFIREPLEVLRELNQRLLAVSEALSADRGPEAGDGLLLTRVGDLEVSRALWEAEMEALVLKAQGKYNSARNAEQRTKTMQASIDDGTGEGDSDGAAEIIAALQLQLLSANGEPGPEEGLQPVHEDLGLRGKAAAQRMKYGA